MKLGILGGTFDPIHNGHLALARHAMEQLELDRVLFVPAFIPPHKCGRHDLSPAPYRYRMVELATSGEQFFEVSDVELNRPDVSFTIDTLHALKKTYVDAQLYLILGADSYAGFSSWKEPGEILKLAKLVVAPRENVSIPTSQEENVFLLKMPKEPFSSSEIRKNISDHKKLPQGILPQKVCDYIQKTGLYRVNTL